MRLSLANTYRPKTLKDLIGQSALQQTLKNSFESGEYSQAYVLTGIRGIGKTTTARIIARSLNCEKGPTAEPCLVCSQCKSIETSSSLDVIEIDAATHTGVANIREILDGTQYKPLQGRHKIYIIDEVHMLSTAAFNALLKTLEEPPPHVIFIFATTEYHKIPATILSRCQKFDLKRLNLQDLESHFKKIAALENISLNSGAAKLLAVLADGSMRDGLSLLDQAQSYSKVLTEDTLRNLLGLSSQETMLGLIEGLFSKNPQNVNTTLNQMLENGKDPVFILKDLLETLHTLSLFSLDKTSFKTALPESIYQNYEKITSGKTFNHFHGLWSILLKSYSDITNAPRTETALKMTLLKISYPENQNSERRSS